VLAESFLHYLGLTGGRPRALLPPRESVHVLYGRETLTTAQGAGAVNPERASTRFHPLARQKPYDTAQSPSEQGWSGQQVLRIASRGNTLQTMDLGTRQLRDYTSPETCCASRTDRIALRAC